MSTVKGFVHGTHVLVWNAEEVVYLERDWRITSRLIGALPGKPRQNAQLGLPLKLTPEEATLLIEKDVLQLLEYTPPSPTQQDVAAFQAAREDNFQAQVTPIVMTSTIHAFASYVEKREKARLEHTGLPPPSPAGEETGQPKRPRLSDYHGHPSFSPLVTISTADPRPPSEYQPCTNWTYPGSDEEKCCYLVYKDLWEQGYTLTTGLKYGGDYLVYEGSPSTVHATYIAIVKLWKQAIPSVSAVARIGSKVKKNVLLCSVDDKKTVHYVTIAWNM